MAPVCCLENRKGSFMVSRQLLLSNSAVGAWRVSCLPAGPSSRHSTGLGGYFLNLPALWYFPTCEFFSRSFCYYIPKALVVGKNALSLSPVCAFFLGWLACSALSSAMNSHSQEGPHICRSDPSTQPDRPGSSVTLRICTLPTLSGKRSLF